MIVRARIILPVSRRPIENGAIHLSENRIASVGRWRDVKAAGNHVIDLGDAILFPGLINAHCHLDYTDMAGMIPPPKSFSDWIKALLALKSEWSYSEYAQSWINGAKMLLRNGTTTVADIEAVPELLPEVWSATPLRVCSLLEMTGVQRRRSAFEIVSEAIGKIDGLAHAKNSAGLSPHALYSTSPALLKHSAEIARERNWLLSTHVSESEEEMEMFERRRGPLFDWLKTQRDMTDLGGSAVDLLDRQGVLAREFVAVHANYISKSDSRLLARRKCSVVHCPRSHAYFGHRPFPRKLLAHAGVNVALGTDSAVSLRKPPRRPVELNMFSEMQQLAKNEPGLPAETILKMATINGARALNLAGKVGELAAGSFADLVAIPFDGAGDPFEAVVQNTKVVSVSMIDGAWAIR